ncbi:hypothetical protein HB815_09635 [Listeria booriae]|uniref:hypothetical protein n=1 Tax=Listeria booriae TaxID=1552123 RepID=UPI001624F81B|nr:hypothetical protein [Listeria booriae]MBC1211193.1 hypothetical protein [Listeria booriae]
MVWFVGAVIVLGLGAVAWYDRFAKSKRIAVMHKTMERKIAYSAAIQAPKIILAGGSDVLYSFDADVIAEKLQQPTVNFGLNIGLGAGFLLDIAKAQAKSGDTLIVSLAYALYWKPLFDVFGFEYFRMYDRKKLQYFTIRQRLYYLMKNAALNRRYVETNFELSASGSYRGLSGTELAPAKKIPLIFPAYFTRSETTRVLEELQETCAEQGVTLYVTYPSTLYFEEYLASAYLKELDRYLKSHFEVIGSPTDFFVSERDIYNSVYHVNASGQAKRTASLVSFLTAKRRGDIE